MNQTSQKLAFPDQRLLVMFEGEPLDAAAEEVLAHGWVLRTISREFATCSPDELARHVFEIVRNRTLELGFVDLDAE